MTGCLSGSGSFAFDAQHADPECLGTRFNRTMLDEWAYARLYRSNASRLAALRDGSTPTIANVPTPRSEESHRSHGWRQRGWELRLVHDLHVADQAVCEDLELRNLPGSNLHPAIAHERPPRIETRLSAESGGLPVSLGRVDRAGPLTEYAAQAFAVPGHPPVSPIRRSREGAREGGDRRAGGQQSCELRDGLAA
jgi:hypothetical protein